MANQMMVNKRETSIVLLVTAAMACYRYYIHPQNPLSTDQNMFTWYDQSQYISIARILSNFHVPMGGAEYSYGLGFPIVGVPFIWLGLDRDPFIIPSIVLMSLSMLFTYLVAARLASRMVAAITVVLLLVASPLLSLTVVPWSTTITTFGLTAALALATSPRGLSWVAGVLYGAIAAWVFSARFIDVVPIVAVASWAILTSRAAHRWWKATVGALVAGAGALVVAITQWISFGSPLITPYAFHLRDTGVNDQSLGQYQILLIGNHFLETFITGLSGGVRVAADPLLAASPYMILIPLGFGIAIWSRIGLRSLHITVFSASLLLTAVYLSFVAGAGQDLIYASVRYWIEFYPYWTILCVIAGRWAFEWMTRGGEHRSVGVVSSEDSPSLSQDDSAVLSPESSGHA
jgi:hypothetical protein